MSTAYLRAAQAYMLISMPTGTSTIFGAFQAIFLSISGQGEYHPWVDKLARNEKFASEIFRVSNVMVMLQRNRNFTYLLGLMSNRRWIKSFMIATTKEGG
jgi:hypothetical protein